jgi:hypothetical protein
MTSFLIQVSGHSIKEKAHSAYQEGANGPRFCDEPLKHGEYFNASPFWQREGRGRREAWKTISPGDRGLLYCTGSVDEHSACVSHLLIVEDVALDEYDGARLTFSDVDRLDNKIPHAKIQVDIEEGRLSERMKYCGQEGFNIALIPDSDLNRILELAEPKKPEEMEKQSHPDDTLDSIVDDVYRD